jgi:DNA-binding NarL/FixJ family response regulator
MMKGHKAKGYILKNIGQEELIKAIETVLSNKIYYSNEISLTLMNRGKLDSGIKSENGSYELLTKREIEVLRLIAEENTNETIANTLSISKRTVDSHRQHIMFKLGVRNSVGLVKAALNIFSHSV